jgi:hypothetical protein
MTTVFTEGGALNNWSPSQQNVRVVFLPAGLASVAGANQMRFTLTFNSGGTGGYSLGTFWCGQIAATEPNFLGDQVQVLFGGNAHLTSPSTAQSFISDWVTLGQNFDATKKYGLSFYVPTVGGNLASTLYFDGNVNAWSETTSHTDQASLTTISGLTQGAGVNLAVTKIEVQPSGDALMPMSLLMM